MKSLQTYAFSQLSAPIKTGVRTTCAMRCTRCVHCVRRETPAPRSHGFRKVPIVSSLQVYARSTAEEVGLSSHLPDFSNSQRPRAWLYLPTGCRPSRRTQFLIMKNRTRSFYGLFFLLPTYFYNISDGRSAVVSGLTALVGAIYIPGEEST